MQMSLSGRTCCADETDLSQTRRARARFRRASRSRTGAGLGRIGSTQTAPDFLRGTVGTAVETARSTSPKLTQSSYSAQARDAGTESDQHSTSDSAGEQRVSLANRHAHLLFDVHVEIRL